LDVLEQLRLVGEAHAPPLVHVARVAARATLVHGHAEPAELAVLAVLFLERAVVPDPRADRVPRLARRAVVAAGPADGGHGAGPAERRIRLISTSGIFPMF